MKKQKIYKRPKRMNFFKLFAGYTMLSVLATGFFGIGVYQMGTQQIYTQTKNELYDRESSIISRISKPEKDTDGYLSVYTYFDVCIFDSAEYQLVSGQSDGCYAVSAIIDEDKNILHSSKERFCAIMKFDNEKNSPETGWYICEFDEAPELYQAYQEMNPDENHFVQMALKSAYVDKKNRKFIPKDVILEYYYLEEDAEVADILGKKIDEKEFHSDVEKSDYEFFEFSSLNSKEYPVATACNIYGTQETPYNEILTQVLEWCPSFKNQGVERGMFALSDTRRIYYSMMPVQINGKTQKLLTAFQIEFWNDQIRQAFYKILLMCFLACEVLALLISLHKNKINKLAYQYEDYQRALTNNLAHDLKTPLMAIQGYAENLIASYKMEDQPKQYLKSIIENVGYTDSLINQTLELNKMQEIKSLKKNSCNLKQLTEQALKKYELLLEERNIQVTTEGEAEISANPETMTTAIENLISNAVKYTAKNGEIKINLSKKAFEIINSVTSKTDTSELLMPFTRGDKSRTNPSGHGLGLSIANQALLANGFKLEISCTDTEFTAKIHF